MCFCNLQCQFKHPPLTLMSFCSHIVQRLYLSVKHFETPLWITSVKFWTISVIYIFFKNFINLYLIFCWQIWSVITDHRPLFPTLITVTIFDRIIIQCTCTYMYIWWKYTMPHNYLQSLSSFNNYSFLVSYYSVTFQKKRYKVPNRRTDIILQMRCKDFMFESFAFCYFAIWTALTEKKRPVSVYHR